MKITRRAVLITGAVAGGGLLLGVATSGARHLRRVRTAVAGDGQLITPVVRIDPDGWVTVMVDKLEMGQGNHTGLAMLVADELDANWDKVRVAHVPAIPDFASGQVFVTFLSRGKGLPVDEGLLKSPVRWVADLAARSLGLMFTGGSSSIMVGWVNYREAAAAARAMLVDAAAQTWNVKPASLRVNQGVIEDPASDRRLEFGEVAELASSLPLPDDFTLKSEADFKLIGLPIKRLDIPDKTNGRSTFGVDVRLPGLRFAAFAPPPLPGASLLDYNTEAAPEAEFIPVSDGLAAVADNWWTAKSALDKAQPTFDPGPLRDFASSERMSTLTEAVRDDRAEVDQEEGDVDLAIQSAADQIERSYSVPYLAHAAMEPMNCTAWVRDDRCDVWTGTQAPLWARKSAAEVAGLAEEQVHVHATMAGGAFGRRLQQDAVERAVAIASQTDTPVKLIYSREVDTTAGFYRQMAASRFFAGIDQKGNLVSWEQSSTGTAQEVDPNPYAVANLRIRRFEEDEPIPTGAWRSVDHSQHAFFIESFMDEVAHESGADPFEYRRRHLQHSPRALTVLDELKALSDWSRETKSGMGRGLAIHESFGSVVGEVVEVVVGSDGIRIPRVTVVIDCGRAVNPDSVRAQVESGVIYGLTAALYGRIDMGSGRVRQSNFHDYPMMRIADAPDIKTAIVASREAPAGVGEPATPPGPPRRSSTPSSRPLESGCGICP